MKADRSQDDNRFLNWLSGWMEDQHITLWGVAELREISTPPDQTGKEFPFAISFVIPVNPGIMGSIQNGPNQACELWKKEHYFQCHEGDICGICSAVCPYGQKVLKKAEARL